MNTDTAKDDTLKGNEDFVAFLHKDAREANIPATCDKAWLARCWESWSIKHMGAFVAATGKVVVAIDDSQEFFRQAAESYEG